MIDSDISDVAWDEICRVIHAVKPDYFSLDVCIREENYNMYRACMRDTRWRNNTPLDFRVGIFYTPEDGQITIYKDTNNIEDDKSFDLLSPTVFADIGACLKGLLWDN